MCATDKVNSEGLKVFNPEAVKPAVDAKTAKLLQYYRLRQRHKISNGGEMEKKVHYTPDWLSQVTAQGKKCIDAMFTLYSKFEKSGTKRSSSSKTRNHIIMAAALVLLYAVITAKMSGSEGSWERSKFWALIYLATFGMHFGALVWMTSVQGLVLYFSLPRHVFGSVQEHLFPAFYTFNSVMSVINIAAFLQMQSSLSIWSSAFNQVMLMSLTLVIELIIRLYVSNSIVMLKHVKTQMETAAGVGQEIGHHVLGELANCPHYLKILKTFRRLHSCTAIGTITTVVCSIYHINYLSEKLCL